MAAYTVDNRVKWEDRWSQPTLKQLSNSLPPANRPHLRKLIDQADNFEMAHWCIRWQGPSWRWTVQIRLGDQEDKKANGSDRDTVLAYVVPNSEGMVICVPLKAPAIRSLPKKRLTKYIREAIRVAKCAVSIQWATWNPATDSDLQQIVGK